MKAQTLFNMAIRGLLKQGCKSQDGSLCLYRGPNGTQCPAGMVIPDRFYKIEMEGKSIGSIMEEYPEINKYLGEENIYLLIDLQRMHDSYLPENWPDESKKIAKEYNLTYLKINK